jgi:hypothetical protein
MPTLNILPEVYFRPAKALLLGLLGWLALCVSSAAQTNINCSETGLRQGLNHGGSITFNCATNTITVTNTIVVTTDAVLDGTARNITISGGGTNRLFTVNPGVKFTVINLTLVGGEDAGAAGTNGSSGLGGSGGAIYNNTGVVVLVSCVLSNHSAIGGNGGDGVAQLNGDGGSGGGGGSASGGAIFNNGGTLLLTNCAFIDNAANAGTGGAGTDGASSGNGNSGGNGGAGGASSGGAIYNTTAGTIVAYDCTFASNTVSGASGGGGGNGTGLGFNGANGTPGAAIGGGIYNDGGSLTLLFSTLNGDGGAGANGGSGKAGLGESDGSAGSAGSTAAGGGVYMNGGTLAATNCTFFGNFVNGGNGGAGGAGGTGGFGGNGGGGGGGGTGGGGAIFNTANGQVTLINCTVSDNYAQGGTGGGGGAAGSAFAKAGGNGVPGANYGGGVGNNSGTVILKNTLLGYTQVGGNGAGIITDGGHNLSDDASVALAAVGSQSGTNVQLELGLLGSNGGPTQTLAITSPTSPAIDAGDDFVGLPVDQRHLARSGPGDIGAYEFNATDSAAALSIRLQGSQVVFGWPTNSAGFTLQSTPALSPATWSVLTNTPAVSGNQFVITNSVSASNRFYRLIK